MKFYGLSCIFPVPDLLKTAAFYVDKLGFTSQEYLDSREKHVCLYRGDVEIILLQSQTSAVISNRKLYGYGYDAYLYTEDLETLASEFLKRGVRFVKEIGVTDYGNKEMVIEDLDGRWIAFGVKLSKIQDLRQKF